MHMVDLWRLDFDYDQRELTGLKWGVPNQERDADYQDWFSIIKKSEHTEQVFNYHF